MYQTGNIFQFNVSGQLLSDDIGLIAADFAYLPDGKIGYINGFQIGTFDVETGENQILDQMPYGSNRYDITYSEKHNALLWAVDTVVALTNIETGQTTILKEGRVGIVIYYNAAASSNGYLTYKTYLTSSTLSTSSARMLRDELRFINADGTDERRLILDFE